MPRFSCLLIALLLSGCAVKPTTEVLQPIPAAPKAKIPVVVAPKPDLSVGRPRAISVEISGTTFEGVSFDSRSHRLVVADQPRGPGSQFENAAAAASSAGGIAALNAGFFTPEGKPLGLVVSAGEAIGGWNSASSLGSGVWYEKVGGISAIVRRESLGSSAARRSRELIQAGPLLVENRSAVGGLEATKASARSLILWDGGTRWWIGCTSPCTLAAVARTMASQSPTGWPVKQALNLDGGRSADLWISGKVAGGPISRRSPWNREVRNFLVLTSR